MDIFSIIMIAVFGIILLVTNIYLLAYYCHKDDRGFGSALVCKAVVVMGLTLAWAQVLLLPLDVSNSYFGNEIDMKLFWTIIFCLTAIFIFLIIPICSNWYESDPEWTCWEKTKYTFCCHIVTLFILTIIFVICYVFLSKAQIPVVTSLCSITNIQKLDPTTKTYSAPTSATACENSETNLEITVSFPIYLVGFISFLSWFLLILFGGIGLAALPLDFIYTFCTRPKRIKQAQIEAIKSKILQNAKDVKEIADECLELEKQNVLKKSFLNKDRRYYNKQMHKLNAGVKMIETEYKIIQIHTELNQTNVCWYWFLLPLGMICGLLTIVWILQIFFSFIVLSDGRPIVPFVDSLLKLLHSLNVAFVAYGIFATLCLYLLWAVMKGNLKFGLRVFLCGGIHPMEKDATYMNSFLFNIGLILLASVSVTQFCTDAFKIYTSTSQIGLIFSVQIRYLKFFVYFFKYNVFIYALLGIFLISLIVLLRRPSDVNSVEKILHKREEEEKELKDNGESQLSIRVKK